MQRPLALHVSALNDEEYTMFTDSFRDLLADGTPLEKIEYGAQSVSLREARAWLRGRYPDLAISQVDEALRLFTPGAGQEAMLTGNQFFALLRVIVHLCEGSKLDRNMVFEQVHFTKPTVPPKKQFEAPPRHPAPSSNGVRSRQPSATLSTDFPISDTNPFHARAANALPPVPPLHPDIRQSASSPTHGAPAGPSQTRNNTNPFLARSKTIHTTSRLSSDKPSPPSLPPRKPPPVIPPRASSFVGTTVSSTPSPKPTPPPVAPKVPHLTSALMKQSLLASKAAQDAKRADNERTQARVLQVLKSSNAPRGLSTSPPNGSRSSSTTDERPQLPPRRRLSPPPPSASSVYSFEQVASAQLPDDRSPFATVRPSARSPPRRSPSASPSRLTTDLPLPPPRHPDSKSEAGVSNPSSPRIIRSKSMRHASPPPAPPQRRKRPESAQITPPRKDVFADPTAARLPLSAQLYSMSSPGGTHHSSYKANGGRHERERSLDETSPLHQFHRTLTGIGPKLDAARYKAEAGFSRRGWVPARHREGGERLVDSDDDGVHDDAGGMDSDGLDYDDSADVRKRALERERTRDEMKWPAGEGWRPLG